MPGNHSNLVCLAVERYRFIPHMEWNNQTKGHRGTLGRGSEMKPWPMSGSRRGLLLACGSLYFIVTMWAALSWSLWRHPAKDDEALFAANHTEAEKLLAVVVPTHAGDLEEALIALASWPKVCSAFTLHHTQLVLYYSGSTGDGKWSEDVIETVERTGGRCFQRTRAVFADLDDKVMVCLTIFGSVGQALPDIHFRLGYLHE